MKNSHLPDREEGRREKSGEGESEAGRRDVLPAIVCLAFGLVTVWLSARIPDVLTTDPLGGAFLPRVLGISLICLSVLLLAAEMLNLDVQGGEAALGAERNGGSMGSDPPPPLTPEDTRRVLLYLGTLGVYIGLMVLIGYLVASFLAFAAMIRLSGERDMRGIVVGSLVITMSLYILFAGVFRIDVPGGMIFG